MERQGVYVHVGNFCILCNDQNSLEHWVDYSLASNIIPTFELAA